MPHPFCYVELHTTNTDEAKAFYSKLFEWKMNDMSMGDQAYSMLDVGEGTGGGITEKQCPDSPPAWLAYIMVDDLDQIVKQAKELGGEVVKERTEIPQMGSFSVLKDPQGAVFAVWQAAAAS